MIRVAVPGPEGFLLWRALVRRPHLLFVTTLVLMKGYRSQPISKLPHYSKARLIFVAVLGFLFIGLLAQLAYLTLWRGEEYSQRAIANLQSSNRLSPPRGSIYDREGRTLATSRRTYSVAFSPYNRSESDARATLTRLNELLPPDQQADIEKIITTRPRWTVHSIARRLPVDDVLPILERPSEFPGVRLADDFQREYAYPLEFAHVLGYLSRIVAEDGDSYAMPRYLPDDMVGRAGIERLYEDQLAGHPGRERRRRATRPGDPPIIELLQATRPGADLTLALDARLQAKAHELLGAETGSIVIMDVDSGDVIVLASTPVFDPRNPALQEIDGRPVGYLNRAIRGQYPPGSVFKVIGALAAMRSGVAPSESVYCSGNIRLAGWSRPFWCNVRTGHGALDLAGSLQRSCNVYFYEMARRLGPEIFLQAAEDFQYGQPTGIELSGEAAGRLPSLGELGPGELTNFSIGQGSLLATPIQVARAYAGLANRRVFPVPRVVTAIDGKPQPRASGAPVTLTQQQITAIEAGLWRVVNEPGGTAFRNNFPRQWGILGKTSTAQNATGGIDGWFAGYFPREAPRYAFAIMIEEAEVGGGDSAAPIMRELLRAMIEPETTGTNPATVTEVD